MRKWHRWVSLVAAIFLLSVAITGVILQFQQFFGEDEATRERLATITSSYTLDTSLGAFAPKLAAAQAAVRAKAGGDKLDNVELQLKGEHPTFVLHIAGGAESSNRKFVVNADTAAIESESSDERESLLLRIHTGEVLGDGGVVGGMLWGTALVVLTITGSLLYWQMYKARAAVKGWRRILWLLLLVFMPARSASAGSPFLTDDPGFAPKGWEIKPAAVYESNANANILTFPVLDLNYSIVEHFKLNLTLAERTVFDQKSGETHTGLADTDFKFKWRFLDEKPGTWIPALSIAPNVTFPTASKSRGIGDGVWRTRLPMQIGKTFGKFYPFGEVGYQWALSDGGDDQVIYGGGVTYPLTDRWTVGAELNGSDVLGITAEFNMLANVGVICTFNQHVQFQAAVGRTLRDEDRGGPQLLAQVLLQFNF